MKKLYKISLLIFLLAGNLASYVANAQSTITISGPTSTCVGDVPTYLLTPLPAGETYAWSVTSQGNILNSGSNAIIQWTSAGTATITVQELDTAGTPVAQGTLNVTVNNLPYPHIVASSSVECAALDTIHKGDYIVSLETNSCMQVCANSTVVYSVENESGATYTWSVDGDYSNSPSGNTCSVTWGDAGWGNISVEEIKGACKGTDSLCIDILDIPDAKFQIMPQTGEGFTKVCLNSTVLFIDQSTSPDESPIISWIWNFDDGTIFSTGVGTSGSPIEHIFTQAGIYHVKLVVKDACGCTNSYIYTVIVSQYEGVKIECPRVVCEDDKVEYTVENPSCSQASWTISGGHILSQTNQLANVKWDNIDAFGFGYLTYNNVCGLCPGETTVKVPVIQQVGTIQGPTYVCANKKYLYSVPQWPTTEFQWQITGDATIAQTDQPNVVSVLSGNSASFELRVHYCNTMLNCSGVAALVVNISPQADILGQTVSCINDQHTYSLMNASTATWTLTAPSGSSYQYTNQTTISPTFYFSGIYTLEISGDFCAPSPLHITVHPKPDTPLEILGPDSVCVGIPIQYSASPYIEGTTFQWGSFTGTVNPATGINTYFTVTGFPANIKVYRVTTDEAHCTSDTLTQSVYPATPPSITLTTDAPPDLTVCGSTQWHFDLDYAGGDLYQWKILDPAMGSIVAGNYTPHVEVLFNNPPGPIEDVQVIVAVTKCNTIRRDTLTMHVLGVPEYTVTPGAVTVCAGEPVNFSISPTPGSRDLSWDFGDGITSTLATPTYAYPNGGSIAVYTPVATIVNPNGCPTTVVTQGGPVSVKPAPVAHVSPDNLFGCGSFNYTLSATVTTGFGSTANYEWTGPTISPAPPNCSTCDTWDINAYGNYHVVVENSNGCQASSNIVHVTENCAGGGGCPEPTPQLITSDSSFIDCGTVKAHIQYDDNGATIVSESWAFPDEAMDIIPVTGFNATARATFEKAGVYPFNYLVTYGDGTCTIMFIQLVYVPFVGDMSYEVSCGSGNLYDITLFDHSNIFPTEEGHIHHSYFYYAYGQWYQITAPWDATEVSVTLLAGDYPLREIIYSDMTTAAPACTTVVNIHLPEKPNADFEFDAPFIPACINDVVIHLDNQSTPGSDIEYLWDFDDGSTNYQPDPDKVYADLTPPIKHIMLTATNSIGCIDSTQKAIEIKDNGYWNRQGNVKPILTASPSPSQCAGTPITLSYFSFPFPAPPNYTWYQGSTPLTPAVSSGSFDVTQPGAYWVMGSDDYGCLVPSSSTTVNFTQVPTPSILGNHEYCDSVDFSLTNSLTDLVSGLTYDWERAPGGYIDNTSTINQNLTTGTYTYTLTVSQSGCSSTSAPFTVTIADPVDTPAVAFDITSCQPYTVQLTATNTESGTYNWSNGGTGATVTAYSGGPYKVTFTSSSGCTTENFIDVPKSPSEYLWIFPTGCFCADDLDFESSTCHHHFPGPFITGPIIPFTHWAYNTDTSVLTGAASIPSLFSNFVPGKINLFLDNGYCQALSGDMYYSEDCPYFGPQGLVQSGDGSADPELEIASEIANQDTDPVEPLLLLIPNPATGQTRVQYRFEDSDSHKSIEVYDMMGRKVKMLITENSAGSIILTINGYTGGIYEICLRQNGSIIAQTKLSVTP